MDAHVHFHCVEAVAATLDAAATNFKRVVPSKSALTGYLLLTQGARERVFEDLRERRSAGDWHLAPTAYEEETVIARRGELCLAIVCGRQIRADDGLEVAALGTCRSFPDGQPFAESLDEVLAAGVVAAIPWGFGKWTGTRGRRVQRVVDGAAGRAFLGDSGSRTWLLGEPALIRRGRTAGALVLAGSDPFPFASDYGRVGAFGFLADFEPDLTGPWRSLRTWLAGLRESPLLYGQPSGPVRFLINQLGVRLYNRRVGSRSA